MTTVLRSNNNYNQSNHLIILSYQNQRTWFASLLTETEQKIVQKAMDKGTKQLILPQLERFIIIELIEAVDNRPDLEEKTRCIAAKTVASLRKHHLEEAVLLDYTKDNLSASYAEGIVLANYQFLKYFKEKDTLKSSFHTLHLLTQFIPSNEVALLNTLFEGVCAARDLVNEPLSYLTAVQLSEEIKRLGKAANFSVNVLDKAAIEALKMGGLLAVNKGSLDPPTFSILEWKPAQTVNKKPIVLVGKGVVYDTGGLSLKPTANSMDFMKCDMAGAAGVIGAMYAVAKAALPVHLICLVPSTDNRPGLNAYAPGDVVTMYSGSTVEVLNTDAEGRMLLADALHYAKQYDPELVIDMATLTGSAAHALGSQGAVFMGTASHQTKKALSRAGIKTQERLVEFPLWKEYAEQLKSDVADLKNLGGPMAGAITAGKFLEHFTAYDWLHIDMAGPAYLHHEDAYRTKGGTGYGVQLIYHFLLDYTT
ncbi:MAG: Cytosol aminopeptidase PepA (EC [uncultured Aureispira sp.]|uniref:Cytosol aminopeptidase PepA (EC) n=1 Tax=uncultured Aureispira sp. TaxID=1331704 RepID=A0A6S6SX77_9BACT|nr:MAG: Cytosol aminopeptidase PepA (EC [uncultured Aureispira sp.]